MNIVIDNAIVDAYKDALVQSLTLLKETAAKLEAITKLADSDKLLTIEQTCEYLGKTQDSLRYYRKFGLEPYKKGQQGVWYRKGDIDAWLSQGRVNRQLKN